MAASVLWFRVAERFETRSAEVLFVLVSTFVFVFLIVFLFAFCPQLAFARNDR